MRRKVFSVLLAITALAAIAPAVAQASGFQGSRAFSPFTPYDVPSVCPQYFGGPPPPGNFGVAVSAVNSQTPSGGTTLQGNEYTMQLPDGTTLTTGNLVLSFQNDLNPAIPPLTGNESGTVAVSASLNNTGTGTVTYEGPTAIQWGPHSQTALAALGEPQPGFVLYNGHIVLTVTNGALTGLSFSGPAVDGCALLAG
jgi:hypothetical protein